MIAFLITPARFVAGIAVTLLAFAAIVGLGALLQSWLDRGLDPPPDTRRPR